MNGWFRGTPILGNLHLKCPRSKAKLVHITTITVGFMVTIMLDGVVHWGPHIVEYIYEVYGESSGYINHSYTPLLTIISVRFQWGRCNLSRYIHIYKILQVLYLFHRTSEVMYHVDQKNNTNIAQMKRDKEVPRQESLVAQCWSIMNMLIVMHQQQRIDYDNQIVI
jgi:hypothetical protein